MDFLQYEEMLSKYLRFLNIVMIIMAVIFVVLSVFSMKCVSKKCAVGTLLIGGLIVVSIYLMLISPIKKDIEQQDYFSYSGEFYVEELTAGNRRSTYIFIKLPQEDTPTRYKVVRNLGSVSDNTAYRGSFVVAKNSRILVDFILEQQ